MHPSELNDLLDDLEQADDLDLEALTAESHEEWDHGLAWDDLEQEHRFRRENPRAELVQAGARLF